ncbi:MAG: hypothetical protein GY749_49835 [Desulfobacteraceae bacterium]|nr:hypothetical protein [Desulfobacteraceae bacterium]
METGKIIFFLILLWVIIVSHAGANSWQDVVAQVNQDIKAVQRSSRISPV